jgi:hypothetical protein
MLRKIMFSSCLCVLLLMLWLTYILAKPTAPPTLRTYDGTTNNKSHPTWGSTDTALMRLAGQAYEDGFSEPRGGGINTPLRLNSPRAVSNAVAAQSDLLLNSLGVSAMLWQWGQFLDHDIDLTGAKRPSEPFAIPVPSCDDFFDPFCTATAEIEFNRSIFDTSTGTTTPRQQLNQITSWIDGSQVYGSSKGWADWKRSFVGGKLKKIAENLLPFEGDATSGFFAAGDSRVNEQIGLIAMHTLFMREHNRLADLIAQDKPNQSDEEIYQRARAIVGAEIQLISYHEFLPLLLGPDALPPYSGYNDAVEPTISNEFSTAAYRVGHSMLAPILLRLDETGQEIPNGHVPLRDAFFNPQLVIDDGIEPILRGLAAQEAQQVDTRLIDEVRHFLFGPPGSGGFDLAALNIQRGRDHGLPSYKAVREALGLQLVNGFVDITSDLSLQNALADVYDNDINQVDLWVGGLAEDHVEGAMVGQTFHTIIKDQFMRLRDGDRFWHQNVDWSSYGLAPDPIIHASNTSLSEVKLSDIIRWNTEQVHVQDNTFYIPPINAQAKGGLESINLDWMLEGTLHGPSGSGALDRYNLYRSVDGGNSYTMIHSTMGSQYSDDDPTLSEGVEYCYQVKALDDADNIIGTSNITCAELGPLTLWIPDEVANPNARDVPVMINLANGNGLCIAAMDIKIEYDDTMVLATGLVSPTIYTQGYAFVANTTIPGEVKIASITSPDECDELSGAGSLFNVFFDVIGQEGEVNPLDFIEGLTATVMYNHDNLFDPLELVLQHGSFTVGFDYIRGDINGDGVVNAADGALALQIASGLHPPTAQQEAACDVNGDDTCNSADGSLILCYAAFEDWDLCGGSESATRLSEPRLNHPAAVSLAIAEPVRTGQSSHFLIKINNSKDFAGGEFVFAYDPTRMMATSVSLPSLTSDFELESNLSQAGMIHVSLASSEQIGDDGTILDLEFTNIRGTSALDFGAVRLYDAAGRDFETSALQREIKLLPYEPIQYELYLPAIRR